jgi:hypothetical protein
MAAEEPGPLPHGLLDRLASSPEMGASSPEAGTSHMDASLLAADLAVLRDSGYLKLALPARCGGAGLNLTDLACAQRQLAARAPATARAVNAHHAWIGAAADALASGETSGQDGAAWVLSEAAQDRVFAGLGAGPDTGIGRETETPGWDWLAIRRVDTSTPGQPAVVYGFTGRNGAPFRPVARQPLGAPGTCGSTLIAGVLIAGMYAWGLALDGMTSYAIARRTFELAVERACGADATPGAHRAGQRAGHPLDRWPVAEASLRLDDMRGWLDEVIANWRQRVAAGGGVTGLDPGRLGLVRQFTARYVAADGAQRVLDLAALIASDPVAASR